MSRRSSEGCIRDLKVWKQERRRAALFFVVRVTLCSLFFGVRGSVVS